MRRSVCVLLAAITTAALFASCVRTKASSFWIDESYQKQPRKVLVIAVVKIPLTRTIVENEFVLRFKDRGIEATPAYAVFPGEQMPTNEVLEKELKAAGYDALLLMQLAKREQPAAPGTAANQPAFPVAPRYRGWPEYYGNGYAVVNSPSFTVEDKYAVAETSLYDAVTEKLIWTATSETWFGEEDRQKLISSYIDVMMDSLQMNKVVPPGKEK